MTPELAEAIAGSSTRYIHRIISDTAVMYGDFTLSSGKKSDILFQLRNVTMHDQCSYMISAKIAEIMQTFDIEVIGGLALGAIPIVSSVLTYSGHYNCDFSGFFVRKEAKSHGAKELIDGHLPEGKEVLLVDDVTTTGGSILQARKAFDNPVRLAFSVVDRNEGARENLAKEGISLISLFRKEDFT